MAGNFGFLDDPVLIRFGCQDRRREKGERRWEAQRLHTPVTDRVFLLCSSLIRSSSLYNDEVSILSFLFPYPSSLSPLLTPPSLLSRRSPSLPPSLSLLLFLLFSSSFFFRFSSSLSPGKRGYRRGAGIINWIKCKRRL